MTRGANAEPAHVFPRRSQRRSSRDHRIRCESPIKVAEALAAKMSNGRANAERSKRIGEHAERMQ